MGSVDTSLIASALAAVALVAGFMIARLRWRARAGARALAESIALQRDLPRSLHPVIDPDVCIGSLSCLKSCPEEGVLGIVDGAARLVNPDHCVGHGRCAAECPVGAIQLVFGTAKRGVDLPELDEFFESSRPGVHVIGELGGMGLIKNAMRQGLECMEHLGEELGRAPRPAGEVADVVIVGSGPAGLAAALGAKQAGLSFRLLEQGTLGGSVAHYPRHKVVMTEAVQLPFHGRFGKRRISKEELLESFERMVARGSLVVEQGVKVTAIEGEEGAFEVLTEPVGRIAARKVVLAVGRRGSPRKLGIPGEELEKVTYSLADPEQYRGAKVLVVGGGDAALEAALQLVEEGGAEVALSYRGEALGRCRAENRARIEALAAAGRLRLLLSSHVRAVGERDVTIEVAGRQERLPNDRVVVSIGGELPAGLLERCGVGMRRYFGEAPGAKRRGEGGGARERYLRATLDRDRARRRFERRLAGAFILAGAVVLFLLAWKGRLYYPLDQRARMASPLHRSMRSAGTFGHGVGIAATAFMLSNFLYAARKHFKFMMRLGHIRSWLHFHVFVGFMSPLVIAFHAAFQSRNLLATGTALSLGVVVTTGLVGRYLYGLVPAAGGKAVELEELSARLVRLADEVEPLLAGAKDPARLRALLARVASPAAKGSLAAALLAFPYRALSSRAGLLRVRSLFPSRQAYSQFHEACLRMQRLRVQVSFYRSLKRLLGAWRVFHASLALFLVLAISAHIGVALYLGYGLLHR